MSVAPMGHRFAVSDSPSAVLYGASANRKLAPVRFERAASGRLRPVPRRPHVASTYVSIHATCPSSCAFKDAGCYVSSGFYGRTARRLDAGALGQRPEDVLEEERLCVEDFIARAGGVPQDGGRDGQRGRDLRLHVGGDAGNTRGARQMARMAELWARAGGGVVWTYTHLWRTIAPEAFGAVATLASTETPAEARRAMGRGYAASIVVLRHPSRRVYDYAAPGRRESVRVLPCPAETGERTCVECRACFDTAGLRARGLVVGFAAHGPGKALVKQRVRDARGDQLRLPVVG